MANVFFRVTPGNFLVDQRGSATSGESLLYGLVWISFTAPVATDCEGAATGARDLSASTTRARHWLGRGLVFNVGIDTVEQAFTAQFRQLAVKIFPGLAEKFIRAIAEAKHGKCGVFQLRRFFGEQELMQRDSFFRRLGFSLR